MGLLRRQRTFHSDYVTLFEIATVLTLPHFNLFTLIVFSIAHVWYFFWMFCKTQFLLITIIFAGSFLYSEIFKAIRSG